MNARLDAAISANVAFVKDPEAAREVERRFRRTARHEEKVGGLAGYVAFLETTAAQMTRMYGRAAA
jgi:hypothetical protein